MPYDPDVHHRRSIRLTGYDYSQTGAYFVTACVKNRECLLSEIVEGKLRLYDVGRLVSLIWETLPSRFPEIELDAFVVMPNHMHGIIMIGGGKDQGAASSAPTLGRIMRAFKSLSGIACNRLLDRGGVSFWQRSYYEHIVRGEDDLNRIRRYIADNPSCWDVDPENPTHPSVTSPI